MGSDKRSNPVDEAVCCSEQLLEDAKDSVGNSCFEQYGSLVIEPPQFDIGSGSLLGSEEPVEQPAPKHQRCNTVGAIVTEDRITIHVSLTTNQANNAVCLSTGGICVDKATMGTGLGGSQVEPDNSCLLESMKVLNIEHEVSELCLIDANCKNEEAACDLDPKVTALKATFSPGGDSYVSSGDCQMPPKEPSFSNTAGDLLVEGDLNPTLSCGDLCIERNVEVKGGLGSVVDGFHVPLHLSSRHEIFTASTGLCGKMNDEHLEGSLVGSHLASCRLGHEASNDQHFAATSGVVVETETPEKEGLCALDPGSSAEPTVPLQSSPCTMVVDSESSEYLVSQGAVRLDGLLEGVNSIAVNDVSCHEDTIVKGNDALGNIGIVELTGNPSTLRRSSRAHKCFPKQPVRRNTKKGSKTPGKLVADESFNFLGAAIRSKRSCSSRVARASSWGLINCLSENIEQNVGAMGQISGSANSGGKSNKQNKLQARVCSPGSKGKNPASSGLLRLKVKLGSEELKGSKLVDPSAMTDFAGNGYSQFHSMKNVVGEALNKSLQYSNLAIDVETSSLCQENSKVDAKHVEKVMESGLSCGNDSRNPSDKKSGSSADYRYLNTGTSPDSEVINQVQDSLFVERGIEGCQTDGLNSSKDNLGPLDVASFATSAIGRRKGYKKDKAPQPGDSIVQNRAVFSPIMDSENGKGNNICSRMDAGLESVDLRFSKELFPSVEVHKGKNSKGSKSKGKSKNKSKITDIPSSMDSSHKGKGDKWTLTNKHPIIESGNSDQVDIMEGTTEAGKHGTDDCTRADISNGKTYEDVSSLHIAPDGVSEPTIRPHLAWVSCDDCHRWRCIPAKLANVIGDTNCRWTCKDNQDNAFADCSIPQEKSDAEINAELDISEEDGRDGQLGGKYNGMRQETALLQRASWTLVKSNIFLHRSRTKQNVDEIMVCHCKPPRDGKFGCGDECLNRMLSIECVQGSCPCGDLCSNQQFQKRNYAKLNLFRSGKKGYGLQALEVITEGQFLIEYVGEVLDLQSYEARQREYASKGCKHLYFMTLNGNEVIDACSKGNLGRFINHSCEPNCRTEKWIVNGEICIGLFALRDIKKGEEVTFDYNYVRVFGAAAKKCYCGSTHCRGYIGGDPLHNDVTVHGDSAEVFPEPVVLCENDKLCASGKGVPTSSSLVVADKKNEDTELQNSIQILSNDNDMGNRVEGFATVGGGGVLPNIVDDPVNNMMVDHLLGKSEALSLEVVSSASFKRPDSAVADKMITNSLLPSVDPKDQQSQANVAERRDLIAKSRPRMKISRPFKSLKGRKSNNGEVALNNDALSMHTKSQVIGNKPKKFTENPTNRDLETVDAKLGELLDSAGGICKRKDASRGYLRLMALTSASGDGNDSATIQSIRDLSMILDVILKTKSRTVLIDIINKNGLQMLHMMMKKCRGNFNKIPILRKLLKVFEFLAEKEILTLEHINKGPSRVGVESFRESIIDLTKHEDKKVHQIARNFRDRWIPRPVRKYNCMDWDDRVIEYNRGPNSSRFLGLHHHWHEQIERLSEPVDHWQDQDQIERAPAPLDSRPAVLLSNSVDSERVEGCTWPTCRTRKRKSRWDKPAELSTNLNHNHIQVNSTPQPQMTTGEMNGVDHVHTCPKQVENEAPSMIDDAPSPGFSRRSFEDPLSTVPCSTVIPIPQTCPGLLKCSSQAPLAYKPERYNSNLAVAYGIPLHIVQEFGTPQPAAADGWVIAPGMVFHPFPPLPLCPKQGKTETHQSCGTVRNAILNGNGLNYQQQDGCLSLASNPPVDHGVTTTSGVRSRNANLNSNILVQHERDSYNQGRRNLYSNNFRSRLPPWGWKRNGGGFRENCLKGGIV